jgi:hypothetical protein
MVNNQPISALWHAAGNRLRFVAIEEHCREPVGKHFLVFMDYGSQTTNHQSPLSVQANHHSSVTQCAQAGTHDIKEVRGCSSDG